MSPNYLPCHNAMIRLNQVTYIMWWYWLATPTLLYMATPTLKCLPECRRWYALNVTSQHCRLVSFIWVVQVLVNQFLGLRWNSRVVDDQAERRAGLLSSCQRILDCASVINDAICRQFWTQDVQVTTGHHVEFSIWKEKKFKVELCCQESFYWSEHFSGWSVAFYRKIRRRFGQKYNVT